MSSSTVAATRRNGNWEKQTVTSGTQTEKSDNTHRPLGAFCIIVGFAALWIARDYDTGTVISMGPGFFPKAISIGLVVLGALILFIAGRDLGPTEDDDRAPPTLGARLRIIGCITASIVAFGAALGPLGLPIATFVMVSIASLGHSGSKFPTVLVTAVVLALFATVLFAWLLGLQIPVLPQVFQ
jgi:hypothetical protein